MQTVFFWDMGSLLTITYEYELDNYIPSQDYTEWVITYKFMHVNVSKKNCINLTVMQTWEKYKIFIRRLKFLHKIQES